MVFDRSGGCASVPFDITCKIRLFVQVIVRRLVTDDAMLSFTMPDADDTFQLTLNKIAFLVQRQPFVVPAFHSLVTRGTTCWRAKWAGESPVGWPSENEDESPLVLKSSWPYGEHQHKGDILHGLQNDRSVPKIIAWGAAQLSNEPYTTLSSRGSFKRRRLHYFFAKGHQSGNSRC